MLISRFNDESQERNRRRFLLALLAGLSISSTALSQDSSYIGSEQGRIIRQISSDRARYSPGDTVTFTMQFYSSVDTCALLVRYSHLGHAVGEDSMSVTFKDHINWTWIPPASDFQGYFVDVFLLKSDQMLDHASIAVDVSSNWARFPRYGFLSNYPLMSEGQMDSTVEFLNRYHINGLQFYDWQYKHNMPLKGTPESPAPYWNDIANRVNYFSTVSGYVQIAHHYGMKAMSYNLLYGAYEDADQDGVVTEWSLYSDTAHHNRVVLQLPTGWASNIYLMDPSNEQWRAYLFKQEDSAFKALPFDGWQIDQLGDWGTMYNYAGQPVDVANSFTSFIQEAKGFLNRELVMNAVNQFGQSSIAHAPVDFLYTEVWDPSVYYSDLTSLINKNYSFSGGNLNTVLAAYMDYDLGNDTGWFSTPGVLMTDAVIFASGGDHLELGEHMLCKEYFPNGNLGMKPDLIGDLVNYYDFLTAYENLLRDTLQLSSVDLSTSSSQSLTSVQQLGAVWYFAKQRNNLQVIQLLNYVNANTLLWRDRTGTQAEPDTIRNLSLSFSAKHVVQRVWTASPDFYGGAAVELPFTQDSGVVTLKLPFMKYWSMIVIEYDSALANARTNGVGTPEGFYLGQNYPNPFNPSTTISFHLGERAAVTIGVYNVLGQRIIQNDLGRIVAGTHNVAFNLSRYASNVYFYRLDAAGEDGEFFTSTGKMLLLK